MTINEHLEKLRRKQRRLQLLLGWAKHIPQPVLLVLATPFRKLLVWWCDLVSWVARKAGECYEYPDLDLLIEIRLNQPSLVLFMDLFGKHGFIHTCYEVEHWPLCLQ